MAIRWGFIGLGLLFGVGLVAYYHGGGLDHSNFQLALLATVLTELTIVALIAINTSSTAISREREDGTLDILLTTPLTAKQYLNGKLLGVFLGILPMLAVPLATVAVAGVYTLAGGLGRADGVRVPMALAQQPFDVLVVLPEAALLLPLSAAAFVCFAVMIGLQSSLRSKGTIGSVVSTVALVGVVGGLVGVCGWQAAQQIPVAGPALAALNPVSLLYVLLEPSSAMGSIDTPDDLTAARVAMGVGTVVAVLGYAGVVLGLRSAMTNSFDVTTRKLAGTR